MNERIEKLAQRVDLLGQFVPTKKPGRYVGYITEEQILEFAELIVRECAAMTRNLSPHGEFAEKVVKEHFGVEE